jgi:hypothetical protein
MVKKKEAASCGIGGCGFPTFAIILLVIGIVWFLNDTGYWTFNIPWVPLVLIIVAIGMVFNKNK